MPFGAPVISTQRDWRCVTCRLALRASAGVIPTPNNPLVVAAVQAICCAGPHAHANEGGWRNGRDGFPHYEFWSGSGGRIDVRVEAEDAEAAWRVVNDFSALSLDVAIALLSGLCSGPFRSMTRAPRRGAVRLGTPAVLAAKGYGRFGAERLKFASAIEAEIDRLLMLRFDVKKYPAFNPRTRTWDRNGITRSDIALIELAPEPPPPDPRECSMGRPLRLGDWADHWFNGGGPMWLSPLPQTILAFDHRNNRGVDVLAKKTALLLALNWGAMRREKLIHTDVRTLLRRIGELRRPSARSLQHSGRFVDRFEEALFRLSDEAIMDVRVRGEEAADLRARNRTWFEAWLVAEVVTARPAFMSSFERSVAPAGGV
jgi:hypothetical protein